MNLKSIAIKAGVSTATVSNVINGNHHKVSKETLEKVLKIIEENNYQPNATARSLASKESKIIGVAIPKIGNAESFAVSPYNTQILALLENYIRNQGYYLMMRTAGEYNEIAPLFSQWNVDGMVLVGASEEDVSDIRKRLVNVPTIFIDTYAQGQEIANVGIDDYESGYLVATYLLGKGHREIAFVGPNVNDSTVIGRRYRGFCDACTERGVTITPSHVFETNTLYHYGIAMGQKIAISDIGFTAVAVMSDIVAFGVIEGLRLCGKSVPNDISVIGFDDLPECRYSNPKLTTVSQNLEKKVRLVGKHLFEMIRNKETLVINEIVDSQIIERQSVKDIN